MNFQKESYSYELGNDLFVKDVLNGKRNGYYVDIGCQHPINGNNTYLFETQYSWQGLSLDVEQEMVDIFNETRSNVAICGDATKFDYQKYFEENNFPKRIDYLSIDIDGGFDFAGKFNGNKHLVALLGLPLTTYRFSVIHFEHGYMENIRNKSVRDTYREILVSLGYGLIARHGDEDWWLDTEFFPWEKSREYFYFGKHTD